MWIYSSKKAQIFILFFPTFLLLSVLLCHNLVIVTRDLLKTILLPKGNIFSIITKTSLKYRIDVHLRCKILFSFWCNFSSFQFFNSSDFFLLFQFFLMSKKWKVHARLLGTFSLTPAAVVHWSCLFLCTTGNWLRLGPTAVFETLEIFESNDNPSLGWLQWWRH